MKVSLKKAEVELIRTALHYAKNQKNQGGDSYERKCLFNEDVERILEKLRRTHT